MDISVKITIIRAFERIVIILVGALTIFLGFYLFLKLPDLAKANGQLKMPGGIELVWANAGPGIFFIALGTIVLVIALSRKLQLETNLAEVSGTNLPSDKKLTAPIIVKYLTATGGIADDQAKRGARDSLKMDLRLLDRLAKLTEGNTSESISVPTHDLESLKLAMSRIKTTMMFSVWDDDWGEFATFQNWVSMGEPDLPPEMNHKAIDYFYDH